MKALSAILFVATATSALGQATPQNPPGAAGDAAAPAAEAPAPPLRTLGLSEATRTALENQPTLLQAKAITAAAAARSDEARSSLLPQVTASAGYTRTLEGPPPPTSPSRNYYQGSVKLSQLIWDFGQTSLRWRAAQTTFEAQRDTERATRDQVTLGVESAFFAARAGKDLLDVARANLANIEAHLRQTEGFVRAGTQPEIALAQTRTDLANARVQLISAQNAYLTEKAQLNQAMGVEDATDYDVASDTLPPVEGEDLGLDPLLAEGLGARPDVASLGAQARAQEQTLGSVKGGYWPSLGVGAAANDAGPQLNMLASDWTAGVTLTWNLFQGGLTDAQVREGRANLDALHAQVAGIRQQVRVDIEQARLSVRAAKEALSAADEALTNAKEQLRLAEGRYRAGVGSIIELGDAQVALTTAAAQKVQDQYNLSTSRAQLLRALGRPPQP
jgi:outer membrane protein